MKIIIDGYGGDHAPEQVLLGCAMASSELDRLEMVITGDSEALKKKSDELKIDTTGMEFVHAPGAISMEDDPMDIRKRKSETSMGMGFELLKNGGGDAFVSGGNTGALAVGCTFMAGRIKGVARTALSPIMPSQTGCFILVDAGANVECRPEMLLQFGIMGSIYMKKVMGIESPRVGLVNVGTEESKGTALEREAHALLKEASLNFYGNLEARNIPKGDCDVVVTDGFTGNVILKLYEGMGSFFIDSLKGMFSTGLKTKIAAALMMENLKAFKKSVDYTEHGGAPFMGAAYPVIKAHGSSNAKAFFNAIRQAKLFAEQGVIDEIKTALQANEQ